MDNELAVVLSDLNFLYDEWDQDVDDDSLRRSSPVLRRFLVERQLLRAWRKAEFQGEPEVVAPALTKHLKIIPLNTVRFATAGGAHYKTMTIASVFESDAALTEEQIKADYELGPPEINQTLTEFADSPSIIVEGTIIKRSEVIKYVSNKLGGAHYDEERDQTYQRLLDYAHRSYNVGGKSAVYFELLSIGQTLVKSPDIQRLRQKLLTYRAK